MKSLIDVFVNNRFSNSLNIGEIHFLMMVGVNDHRPLCFLLFRVSSCSLRQLLFRPMTSNTAPSFAMVPSHDSCVTIR